MSTSATLRVGCTSSGYRVRVEGRGTLRESPAVRAFARRVLDGEPGGLVIDLEACDYLDSTFLGCLADLRKRYGVGHPPRFFLAASPEVRRRLLAPNHLDAFFQFVEVCPDVVGDDQVLPPLQLERDELGHHLLECHRRLAEHEGPNQADMKDVADRLARELVVK